MENENNKFVRDSPPPESLSKKEVPEAGANRAFAGGGVLISNKVSEGWGVPKVYRDPMGVNIFYTHKKRNRTYQNTPFAQLPHCPGCPFCAICPCCHEKLPAPWGGGLPIFDNDSEGGGIMRFLRTLFPKRTTPPLTRNSEQSLPSEHLTSCNTHDELRLTSQNDLIK